MGIQKAIRQHERFRKWDKRVYCRCAAVVLLAALFAFLYLCPDWIAILVKRMSTGLNPFETMQGVVRKSGHELLGPTGNYVLFSFLRIVFYAGVAAVILSVMALVPQRRCLLTKWGERSLQIYLVHLLVYYAYQHFVSDAAMMQWSHLWILSPVVISVLLTALIASLGFIPPWIRALKGLCRKAVALTATGTGDIPRSAS